MGISILIVIASLVFVSLLMALWRHRLRLIGITFIVGSIYLLATSDVFVVIRVPTICVVGLAVLLAIMIMLPSKRPEKPHDIPRRTKTRQLG